MGRKLMFTSVGFGGRWDVESVARTQWQLIVFATSASIATDRPWSARARTDRPAEPTHVSLDCNVASAFVWKCDV